MNRFHKILIWIENEAEDRPALDQALAVARESGAALTLAHAVEPPGRLFRTLFPQAEELQDVVVREWQSRLEEIAEPLRREGLEVAVRLLVGKPFLAFTREVLRGGHDLLVKPAESTEGGTTLGASDMHLLRKCPCAVWITNPEAPASGRILALVDPDPAQAQVHRRVLEMASSLGEQRGVAVDVLHAWEASGERLLASRVQPEELTEYVEEARSHSAEGLRQAIESSGRDFPEERVHLIKGMVSRVVPEFVRHHEIGLIVMGTLGRTGIQGMLIGNTAETILSKVHCPVLTVKPEGFVSPIAA